MAWGRFDTDVVESMIHTKKLDALSWSGMQAHGLCCTLDYNAANVRPYVGVGIRPRLETYPETLS